VPLGPGGRTITTVARTPRIEGSNRARAAGEEEDMRKLIVVAVFGGALGWVGVAGADPNLSDVAPHRHYVRTSDGTRIEVGPRVCDSPELQQSFNQFHANTHTHNGVTGEIGPAAPGLHNDLGAELTFGSC
jgi:hypothetical protein